MPNIQLQDNVLLTTAIVTICSTAEPRYIELGRTIGKNLIYQNFELTICICFAQLAMVHEAGTFSEGHVNCTASYM